MGFQNSRVRVAIAAAVGMLITIGSVRAANIKLRERVVPKGSVVRLGDVAEITSADRQEARQLAAVPLMPAPAPDTDRFLRQGEITDMLAANGVELADIRFDGAEKVRVLAPARPSAGLAVEGAGSDDASENQHAAVLAGASVASAKKTKKPVLDEARLKELQSEVGRMVDEYLKSKPSQPAIGKIECNVTDRQLGQLAAATSTPVCAGGSEPWTGRQRLTLSFATPSGSVCVPVNAEVAEAAAPAVVATRAVARGNVITAADVEVRMIEPTGKMSGQRTAIDSVDSILGKEARQAIRAGDVMFTDLVQSPVLVKRGELITVASQSGGIRVRTSARAIQDGASGDLVQVESMPGKQRFDARVVGLREAAVLAPTHVSEPELVKPAQTARRLGAAK
jgi:flagella basal body P-ring formation protein FlgA